MSKYRGEKKCRSCGKTGTQVTCVGVMCDACHKGFKDADRNASHKLNNRSDHMTIADEETWGKL